jgi:mRNA interferase RelE/StbE
VSYEIEYAPKAVRAIEKLSRDVQRRVVARIEALAKNPRPSGAIKLAGQAIYRVRVGDYRVLYAIADERLVVLIVDVGHRREIYRDL